MVVCEVCLNAFQEDDMFLEMCDNCFSVMYGSPENVEPFKKRPRFDDES